MLPADVSLIDFEAPIDKFDRIEKTQANDQIPETYYIFCGLYIELIRQCIRTKAKNVEQ